MAEMCLHDFSAISVIFSYSTQSFLAHLPKTHAQLFGNRPHASTPISSGVTAFYLFYRSISRQTLRYLLCIMQANGLIYLQRE